MDLIPENDHLQRLCVGGVMLVVGAVGMYRSWNNNPTLLVIAGLLTAVGLCGMIYRYRLWRDSL